MTHDHIVKSFDSDLARLDSLVAEMGGLAEAQLADAVDALVKRDREQAMRVVEADRRIDALEHAVDEQAIRMLALRQPMAADLRTVITALKTASVLERIGDYAKNIAKRTVPLSATAVPGSGPGMRPVHTIAGMARTVAQMIKDVIDAYLARRGETLAEVRKRDEEVDALHSSLFRELVTYMMEDPRSITPCTHLLFVAKNIERIGDHATNIAEHVHFLVTGKAPEDERPKGDDSSFAVIEPAPPGAPGEPPPT